MQLENSNSYPRGNTDDDMIYTNIESQIKTNILVMAVFTLILAIPLMFLIRKSTCAMVQTFWIVATGIACTVVVVQCTTDWSITRAARSVQSVEHRLVLQQQHMEQLASGSSFNVSAFNGSINIMHDFMSTLQLSTDPHARDLISSDWTD